MTGTRLSHSPLSEILGGLVEPPAGEGSLPREPGRYRDLLLFAAAAWNASRLGGLEWKAHLRELFDGAPRAAEAEREFGKELFETLSARAEEEYPEDPRRVADVRVARREDGRLQVYALSRPGSARASDRRLGAARSDFGEPADDPLAGPRDLLDRTYLPAGVEAAVEKILDQLLEARGSESPGDGCLARAGELVVVHAVTEPNEIARSRKSELWAAGALHAAPFTAFAGHADPDRLTTERAARLFDVSAASVSNRSVALRNSWELALEAGAHPRFPGAPAGMVRLAAATLGSSGGEPRGRPEPGIETPLRERVEEALGPGRPESVGRSFDLDRFVEDHGLETADRHALRAAAERAVEAYYREVLGKDPAGRSRSTVLERPAGFGSLVREVLRSGGASEETRDLLALRAVASLATPAGDAPDFVLLAVARLAARDRLAGPALAAGATLALRERGALDGIRTEELRPLWRALAADPEIGLERRVEVLGALVRCAGTSRGSRRGAELLSTIARDEALPESLRREVLERIVDADPSPPLPDKTTRGVRRRAYRHLAEMADEPGRAALGLAREGRQLEDFDRWRAAAEVVAEHGASLSGERVRELVRDGLRAPDAAVRQAWYRTGVKLVGGEVRECAPEDVLRRAESRKRPGETGGGGDPTQTSLF